MRQLIVEEQRYRCAICNYTFKGGFHIDHKRPQAKGGTSERHNLWALCVGCHNKKTLLENSRRVEESRNRTRVVQEIKRHQRRLAQLQKTKYNNSSLCLGCGAVYSSFIPHRCSAQENKKRKKNRLVLTSDVIMKDVVDWDKPNMF